LFSRDDRMFGLLTCPEEIFDSAKSPNANGPQFTPADSFVPAR
jgi:hypothetical protein